MSRAVIEDYFTAINNERWDDFSAVLADDAVYTTTGAKPREGRDTVVEFFTTLFRAWKEHYDDPTFFILGDGSAAVEVEFRGVSTAGRPIEFTAVDVFKFRDDKIASLTTWYDLAAVRKSLAES